MKNFSYKHISLCILISLSSITIASAQKNCSPLKPASQNNFEYIPELRINRDSPKVSCLERTVCACAIVSSILVQSYLITHAMGAKNPQKNPGQYPTQSPTNFNPIDPSLRGFLDKEKND